MTLHHAGADAPEDLCLLIAGRRVRGDSGMGEVRDKFTGELIARVGHASRSQTDAAVMAAREAFRAGPPSPYERYRILRQASDRLAEHHAEVLKTLVKESGFALGDARNEIERCVQTLELCAEEAKRITGEGVPIEAAPGHEHRMAFTIRVPVGVVCAITPFNSPLNTVAHKIASALAAGNAVVLKPAEQTPITANRLAELLIDSGLPPGFINVVHGPGEEVGMYLLENPDIDFYGFTGSSEVGALIVRTIGLRRSSLELGSISATIVCGDADLDWAVPRIVNSSFRKAGQVCTSVQRLFVEQSIADELTARLKERISALKVGDPRDPDSFLGPMIDEKEAERVASWIDEAVARGARIVAGGQRTGPLMAPTLLADVDPQSRIICEEVFGPVVSIVPFKSLDEAIDRVNDTRYGLTAGIFTRDIGSAMRTARQVRVGSIHINETSSARADLMPSGGVKDSGMGREGPRYAVHEMTEERLVTISCP